MAKAPCCPLLPREGGKGARDHVSRLALLRPASYKASLIFRHPCTSPPSPLAARRFARLFVSFSFLCIWCALCVARLTKMEKNLADEAEGLSEQRKAVALARVRLHEQQMEMALQVGGEVMFPSLP